MRGKRMRCPNNLCREILEVREATEPDGATSNGPSAIAPSPPPAPEKKGYVSGSIGEMVPFVTAEAAEAAPTALPTTKPLEAPSWQGVPPPVRKPAAAPI